MDMREEDEWQEAEMRMDEEAEDEMLAEAEAARRRRETIAADRKARRAAAKRAAALAKRDEVIEDEYGYKCDKCDTATSVICSRCYESKYYG